MRVYDIYRFYTGSKRTIAELFTCIRQFLTDQQLSFDELLLLVAPSHWGRPADKYVYQYLPALRDVPIITTGSRSVITSTVITNTDAQLRPVAAIEANAVAALLTKIPRGFNPDYASVVLSGIPFSGHSAPVLSGEYSALGCELPSSHIQLFHDGVFPSTRFVEMRMDVTAEEGVLDSMPAAIALREALNLKWSVQRRAVVLTDAEKQQYADRTAAAQPLADQIAEKIAAFELPYNSCQSTEGYSIARPLKKVLKPLGFTSTGYAHNTLFFRRINQRGHGICLSVDVSPMAHILRPAIALKGLGFSFSWDIGAGIPLNQQDADAFCRSFAEFLASDFANNLEALSSCFPPSPEWFFTPSDVDC